MTVTHPLSGKDERMSNRRMRLGLTLPGQGPVSELIDQTRRAEQLGFDVVLLIDHLGFAAPLPPLVAMAAAAPRMRVSNLVLNASFYRPALLARDLASVDSATGGRLEIGLGAGYVEAEFLAAGLPFLKPAARLQLLKEHIIAIRRQLSDPGNTPPSVQRPPPIMVAGMGDRMLAMAAQHADIVAVGGIGGEAAVAERAAYILNQAGVHADDVELAFSFFQVSLDDPSDLSVIRQVAPDASEVDLRNAATLLDGTVTAAVDRVQRLREANFSYFTFHKTEATSWNTLEKLTSALR
jgi:probable F420-dependent oxidoreductase